MTGYAAERSSTAEARLAHMSGPGMMGLGQGYAPIPCQSYQPGYGIGRAGMSLGIMGPGTMGAGMMRPGMMDPGGMMGQGGMTGHRSMVGEGMLAIPQLNPERGR